MNRTNRIIEKLVKDGYFLLRMPFSEKEKNDYAYGLKQFFKYAFKNADKEEKFKKLLLRKDQGSLLINSNKKIESLLYKVVSRSDIIEIAKIVWACEKIYYASSFSHYRFVDPAETEQMNYSLLHVDKGFLKTKSLNICLPATAYGREYSGIEIFTNVVIDKNKIIDYKSIEPYVELGEALVFNENTLHRRSVNNKTKIRINTEFRIFPDYTDDKDNRFNLKELA